MTQQKWDQFYDSHGRFYLTPHELFGKVVNHFYHYEVKKVLDLGCGSGRHLIPLIEKGFDVTGIDYSPSAASLAEKWLNQKELPGKVYVTDLYDEIEIIETESMDAVVAVNSLQYNSQEIFQSSIKEVNRILKTGGIFFIVVPSKETSIKDLDVEQLFFSKESLKLQLEETFRILEIGEDKNKGIYAIAQEK